MTRPSSSHARGRLRRFCLLLLLLRDQRASSFSRRKNHSDAPSHCTAPAAAVDAVAADDGEDRSANAFPISCKKKPRRNSRRRLNSNSLSAEERERREIAFPPRAPFRFCLQYLMSDSAAVAGLIGSQPQLPIAYSEEGASREATAAEHGATPRGKSTSTQETVDSEDNASECRKNVI